jgi:hypothetical protein
MTTLIIIENALPIISMAVAVLGLGHTLNLNQPHRHRANRVNTHSCNYVDLLIFATESAGDGRGADEGGTRPHDETDPDTYKQPKRYRLCKDQITGQWTCKGSEQAGSGTCSLHGEAITDVCRDIWDIAGHSERTKTKSIKMDTDQIKTGDILLVSGKWLLARMIQKVTRSKWNHAGVMVWLWGELFVAEAEKGRLTANQVGRIEILQRLPTGSRIDDYEVQGCAAGKRGGNVHYAAHGSQAIRFFFPLCFIR